MKNIWIINHYASHLEQRHLNLAKGFAKMGCSVVVIASSFHHGKHEYLYNEDIKFLNLEPNVTYVYLKSKPSYKTNGYKRVLNMLGFCIIYMRKNDEIVQKCGKPDYLIASSAHPFTWEIGYSTAKKYGAKFIAEFRDLWPLSLVEIQGKSKYNQMILFLGVIEKRAYRRADAIVSTMPKAYLYIKNILHMPIDNVYWMPNGINCKRISEIVANNSTELPQSLDQYLENNWCCIYTGSLVKSECLPFLVKSFSNINNSNIHFAIVGTGHDRDKIQILINSNHLQNQIKIFDPLTFEQVQIAIRKSKLCVAACENLRIHQYGLSMNKLNDYLYSGVPVLFACDADNVVKDSGQKVVPYGDTKAFAEGVLDVYRMSEADKEKMTNMGIQLIQEQYDYSCISKKYLLMLCSL